MSIHAPREGGDSVLHRPLLYGCISIHAPREGGDFKPLTDDPFADRFQSTPPARGATAAAFLLTKQQYYISIHAPREGGDSPEPRRQPFPTNFNPRPREGGDAATVRGWATAAGISSHAPRAGGDWTRRR